MKLHNDNLIFSPSDLILFLESPFASWMEHFSLISPEALDLKDQDDAMMLMLQDKGAEHESSVLEGLKQQGLTIANIGLSSDKKAATIQAMKEGADVVFQACLSQDQFTGFADFLVKVPGSSQLGDYHYEIWDTKLSKSLQPYYTIQLCCYQEMIAAIQGRYSNDFVIILGDQTQQRLRTQEFYYYYQSVKNAFLQLHEEFDLEKYPNPSDSKSWGCWSNYAKQLLKEADHLSQVATITRSQIKKLNADGIQTMQDLINSDKPSIKSLNTDVYKRLKAQAQIQRKSEGLATPLFEIINTHEKLGLALLPQHSENDVYFDIEGFPLIEGGLEYLWGCTYFDEKGDRKFIDFWAHNEIEEKIAFKSFIEWVYARWQQDPTMHIYHYANYEIAACKKLMCRYGVCELEVDQLLRNGVFVDLYKIVKNGLLIGEPKYSIKNVEHLYRGKRETEVGSGGDSVVVYENWRVNPDGLTWQTSKVLKSIRDYNIDDCNSTQELVAWLHQKQQEFGIQYVGKKDIVEKELSEEITAITNLRDQLLSKAESLKSHDIIESQICENMAWALEFHRREAKPVFWRLFERMGLTVEELYDDLDCLVNCIRTDKEPFKPTPKARSLAYEYAFDPHQEFKMANTTSFYILGEEDEKGNNLKATLLKEHSSVSKGRICLQLKEPLSVVHLIPDDYVNPKPIPKAIETVVRSYYENQLNDDAILHFLRRDYPRIKGIEKGEIIVSSHKNLEKLDQIKSAICNLDNSYIVIQGPPGAGKTFTGKHVIAELLKQGKKVGISSNSHKAINNLLIGVAQYCQNENIPAHFCCTKNTDTEIENFGISEIKNDKIVEYLDGACVVGTTAWGFSREELNKQFDYLFIDEAGQVSVANLIAMSQSAHNLVLMGDQMQLGQPAQGTHPGDSGLSILDYLLKDHPTIEPNRGIFLDTTYRMHSKVNEFISQAIYEGKLNSHKSNDLQVIQVPDGYKGVLNKEAGVVFIPVEHEGNTQASDEEVQAIQHAVNELIGRIYTDKEGNKKPIILDDILFVAPYNFQVTKLKSALGENAKLGSVDKFQGQEAPIVFFSLCASDANDSPRGMDFLFDKNRLNVANSRAQSLAIVVGNPNLINCNTSNIKQQKLVNVFCHLINYSQY